MTNLSARGRTTLLSALLLCLLSACQTPTPYDYSAFLEHPPRSILVLPPLDESMEADATYECLTTLTLPLAERGYYVYPVAIVALMMRENGLPTPYEMHQVPLAKLVEVFDPDAVLYMKVTDWGSSYHVINSSTTVTMQAVLVDAATGEEIWRGERSGSESSSGGGLVGMLSSALVTQVASSLSDPTRALSQETAWALFSDPRNGLLAGPYHADHEQQMEAAAAGAEPK